MISDGDSPYGSHELEAHGIVDPLAAPWSQRDRAAPTRERPASPAILRRQRRRTARRPARSPGSWGCSACESGRGRPMPWRPVSHGDLSSRPRGRPPLERLLPRLHPWSSYVVLPTFKSSRRPPRHTSIGARRHQVAPASSAGGWGSSPSRNGRHARAMGYFPPYTEESCRSAMLSAHSTAAFLRIRRKAVPPAAHGWERACSRVLAHVLTKSCDVLRVA